MALFSLIIEWKIPTQRSPFATAPISPSANFKVIILFAKSTLSIIPPPGDLHLSPICTSTRLNRSSGTSNHWRNFKLFNSALPYLSITPFWSLPIANPSLKVIFPSAVSGVRLDKNLSSNLANSFIISRSVRVELSIFSSLRGAALSTVTIGSRYTESSNAWTLAL